MERQTRGIAGGLDSVVSCCSTRGPSPGEGLAQARDRLTQRHRHCGCDGAALRGRVSRDAVRCNEEFRKGPERVQEGFSKGQWLGDSKELRSDLRLNHGSYGPGVIARASQVTWPQRSSHGLDSSVQCLMLGCSYYFFIACGLFSWIAVLQVSMAAARADIYIGHLKPPDHPTNCHIVSTITLNHAIMSTSKVIRYNKVMSSCRHDLLWRNTLYTQRLSGMSTTSTYSRTNQNQTKTKQ